MTLREALLASLENLAAHKLRSVLAMLGVVFGVGAVIAMLAIGAGAESQALEMLDRLGLRNVLVRAKPLQEDERQELRRKSQGLSLRDVEAIRDAVPGATLVLPKTRIETYKILAPSVSTSGGAGPELATVVDVEAEVYGVEAEHPSLTGLTLQEGRFLDPLDVRRHAQVAVIGAGVRRHLFGFDPALGRRLKVNDVWLTVVGVLAGGQGGGQETDSFQGVQLAGTRDVIYLPISTSLRKFDQSPLEAPLSEILVRLDEADTVSGRQAAAMIDSLLDHLHAGVDDYELVVPEALLEQSRRTQRLFNLVMGCIAGISLLVGGIGIMNIMLATVLERTREIGVRRAVGARRRDILFQFVVESFTVSSLGGVAGILMGIGIARAIAASAGWPTVVTPLSVVLATGVAVAVGLASGLYPAVRAARLDPITSLRYE